MAPRTQVNPRRRKPIAQTVAAPPPKVIRNRVAFVIDSSSSMSQVAHTAKAAVNGMLDTTKEKTAAENQQTDIAVLSFAYEVSTIVTPRDSAHVQPLEKYETLGNTALYDGILEGIRAIDDADKDTSYLLVVFTDGEENNSKSTVYDVQKAIAEKQRQGNWTFAIQVPYGKRQSTAARLGIPLENVQEWENTVVGTRTMEQTTTAGLTSYFGVRSAGAKAMSTFYADLSDVKPKDIKIALDDQSDRFKAFTVDKEDTIREFVERKTSKPYVIGSTFYQLSKTEKIQPQKQVLVIEKGKKAIWGGDQARKLIGLPADGKTHVKVEPYNLGHYEIYAESRSVNRKLVRGTKVLVDVTKTKGETPTWNHDAV